MIYSAFALLVCMLTLIGGVLAVNSIIVFNTTRYMAIAPTALWRDPAYIRALPNILARIRDAGFHSPWPTRVSALSAYCFRRRLIALLTAEVPNASHVVQQHLGLWAFIQLHQDHIHYRIHCEQVRRIVSFLSHAPSATDRDMAITRLHELRTARTSRQHILAFNSSTSDTVSWFERLHMLVPIFAEHGYGLSETFETLERWRSAETDELVAGLLQTSESAALPQGL